MSKYAIVDQFGYVAVGILQISTNRTGTVGVREGGGGRLRARGRDSRC